MAEFLQSDSSIQADSSTELTSATDIILIYPLLRSAFGGIDLIWCYLTALGSTQEKIKSIKAQRSKLRRRISTCQITPFWGLVARAIYIHRIQHHHLHPSAALLHHLRHERTHRSSRSSCYMVSQLRPKNRHILYALSLLTLSGFGQNGSQFKDECQPLTHLISQSFYESSSFDNYPDGINFLFPTAPTPASSLPVPGRSRSSPHHTPDNNVQSSAWWLSNDVPTHQQSLNLTFQYLKSYLDANGPIDGIIGFDQGATLAAMVASWFESSSSISRLTSLSLLQSPLSVPLPASQTQPLKFVVCLSGWQLSSVAPYCDYRGFYEPKIGTKTLVVMGVLDRIVGDHLTRELLGSLKEGELVVHEGGHEVPGETADDTVDAIAEFIERCVEDWEYQKELNRENEMTNMQLRRDSACSIKHESNSGRSTASIQREKARTPASSSSCTHHDSRETDRDRDSAAAAPTGGGDTGKKPRSRGSPSDSPTQTRIVRVRTR